MRGSLEHTGVRLVVPGIIPAHAGLTWTENTTGYNFQDHPRACGAHIEEKIKALYAQGSSPRMRGSPTDVVRVPDELGIIPAHAGLTRLLHRVWAVDWDHPRACGAHFSSLYS